MRVIRFTPHKRSKTNSLEYEVSDKEPIAVLPYDDIPDIGDLIDYRPLLKRRIWRNIEKMRKEQPVYRHVLVRYKQSKNQANHPLTRF